MFQSRKWKAYYTLLVFSILSVPTPPHNWKKQHISFMLFVMCTCFISAHKDFTVFCYHLQSYFHSSALCFTEDRACLLPCTYTRTHREGSRGSTRLTKIHCSNISCTLCMSSSSVAVLFMVLNGFYWRFHETCSLCHFFSIFWLDLFNFIQIELKKYSNQPV